jgi:hypothetical protein
MMPVVATRRRAFFSISRLIESDLAGGVIFRAAAGLDENAVAQVQATVCHRLLPTFVRRGLLTGDDRGRWGGGAEI